MDLGVMTTKEYFTLLWTLEPESHNRIQFSVLFSIPLFWVSYSSLGNTVGVYLARLKRCVVFWPSTRPNMPFKVMHWKEVTHSNGSYERKSRRWARLIIWDKVKFPLQSDASEASDLWTAWQLFPLDDDQTCHSKDWVGDRVSVELLYYSVKTEVRSWRKVAEKMWQGNPRQAEGAFGAPRWVGV